jgi:hypothetical protein
VGRRGAVTGLAQDGKIAWRAEAAHARRGAADRGQKKHGDYCNERTRKFFNRSVSDLLKIQFFSANFVVSLMWEILGSKSPLYLSRHRFEQKSFEPTL